MLKFGVLPLCLLLSFASTQGPRPTPVAEAHRQWLEARYAEATSIKAGMTRADLLKLFEMDGGLQPLHIPERYTLKSCGMIKVDVKFDVPEHSQVKLVPEDLVYEQQSSPSSPIDYQVVSNDTLKIVSISKPYLEHGILD